MLNLKLGKAQFSIYYGYEATVRSKILKKLASLATEDEDEDSFDRLGVMMEVVPELLLVGLQKYHSDEYGYNYKTEEGKEESLSKVYELLDDYFEGEDANFTDLMESLQEELMNNGFLSKMFAREVEKQNTENKKK